MSRNNFLTLPVMIMCRATIMMLLMGSRGIFAVYDDPPCGKRSQNQEKNTTPQGIGLQ
jgi:hypothetical protein